MIVYERLMRIFSRYKMVDNSLGLRDQHYMVHMNDVWKLSYDNENAKGRQPVMSVLWDLWEIGNLMMLQYQFLQRHQTLYEI